jgi:hypothetical protein
MDFRLNPLRTMPELTRNMRVVFKRWEVMKNILPAAGQFPSLIVKPQFGYLDNSRVYLYDHKGILKNSYKELKMKSNRLLSIWLTWSSQKCTSILGNWPEGKIFLKTCRMHGVKIWKWFSLIFKNLLVQFDQHLLLVFFVWLVCSISSSITVKRRCTIGVSDSGQTRLLHYVKPWFSLFPI